MDAELKDALTAFRRAEEGEIVLILDPYHPDAFAAGEFLFGDPAKHLFDQVCLEANDSFDLDRMVVVVGKAYEEITQTHSGPSAEVLDWVEEFEKWAMARRQSISILAFIEREELKERVNAAVERSKERDSFTKQFKIKRGK